MYQYYNYLIFEKNKESFNDINPDLRKMTYKYDQEVKNAYMTVQASPEVIKAAMGMNLQSKEKEFEEEKIDKGLQVAKQPSTASAEKDKVATKKKYSKDKCSLIF